MPCRADLWFVFPLALFMPLAAPAPVVADGGQSVALARDGKALLRIVVAEKAPDRVQQAARTLAAYLGKISGASFAVAHGEGTSGIAVGLPAHFPGLKVPQLPDPGDPTRREDYLLHSHAGGVHVLGTTELAVEHAVWDLLYRLGHRQFFPGPNWEVIPRVADLKLAVDVRQHPSYYSRRIWYGYGPWDYAARPYQEWCARNRAVGGIELHTGHAYDGILRRNQAAFKAHPEYLGLVGDERRSSKFCIGNPELRKLVVSDVLGQFRGDPARHSVSLDPSDGGGWCQCERCKALGSVSDRALTLANEAAAALAMDYPDRYIGMYAYSEHSPPPALKVHPRVIISVATAFIRDGYTVEQLLAGWARQGATLGVREYYSVNTWDRDLPGAARGSRPDYLKATIPHFHALGARFLSAESSDNWGPNGLGYYLASRLLWDVREAGRVEELTADFLDRAFGPAREPMARFYGLLNGPRQPLLSDDLLGRMYRCLAEARGKTDDSKVKARLDDLVLYTHHVALWLAYSTAAGQARQQAFEALIRHAYRMRTSMMVHAKALYRDVAARDKSVSIPREAAWNVPEGKNPWKSSAPFGKDELEQLVSEGVARHKLLDFTPMAFSTNLEPAARLGLPQGKPGSLGLYSRGVRNVFVWMEKPGTLALTVKAGLIYDNRGPAKLALYPTAEPEGKAVAQAEVAPDKKERPVELKTTFAGLHRVEISDGSAGTSVTLPDGLPATVCSSFEAPAAFHGRWSLVFYVPKGTKVVGGYASGVGTLLNAEGKEAFKFGAKPGYFSVPVPPGQDGKVWRFQQCQGQRLLMTVPPCLARSAQELLLPAEVIKADMGR